MRASEQIETIAAALSAAQGEFPAIDKNRTVTVKHRNSDATYTYGYATLDEVLAKVRPALAKHALALLQYFERVGDAPHIVTRLQHASGQFFEHTIPMAPYHSAQDFGGAVTYARRYGIVSLLCIAADEDDDADAPGADERAITDRTTGEVRRRESQPVNAQAGGRSPAPGGLHTTPGRPAQPIPTPPPGLSAEEKAAQTKCSEAFGKLKVSHAGIANVAWIAKNDSWAGRLANIETAAAALLKLTGEIGERAPEVMDALAEAAGYKRTATGKKSDGMKPDVCAQALAAFVAGKPFTPDEPPF